jgi:glutathione peroxidase-family protein
MIIHLTKICDFGIGALYSYLKSAQGGLLNKAIKWNFTKFLIDREGNVIKRYASQTKPEEYHIMFLFS